MAAKGLTRTPWITIVGLAIACAFVLLPLLWMTLSAFKPDAEINSIPPTFWPRTFTLESFFQLFDQFHFGLLTINSLLVAAGCLALSLVLGGAAAYGFSRYPFFGSGLLLGLVLVTRMVTPASLVLPLYLLMDFFHLTNTLISLIIGITTLNLPFVVWLLKPFFDALPREIEEAGKLDGLGPIGVWWRIAVPVAGPGFLTVALFTLIDAWQNLLIPITMSTRAGGWTLAAGMLQMQTGYKIYWGALMSGGLYLSLPIFLLALLLQKYLTRGLRSSF
jgi:ABC-type glycerol-3-phosphate transport system permease component